MVKTGNTFIDYLLLIITFIPLVPALLIIFQKDHSKAPFNILMVLCILDFIKGFSYQASLLDPINQNIITNIISLLELILFIQLFKNTLEKKIKDALKIFQIAFLSSVFTWFSIKGWGQNNMILDSLLNGVLISVLLLSLPPLIRERDLGILRSPLFWIAGGTLFYLLIALLLEWIGPCCKIISGPVYTEDYVFLSIAALIRYLLYLLAILVTSKETTVDT